MVPGTRALRCWLAPMLVALASGCWFGGPERISEMDDLRLDVDLFEWGTFASLRYDGNAVLGCAELRSGFGGTLNGEPHVATSAGGRTGADSCRGPGVEFGAPMASEYLIRVFDSSKTLEMDVVNPWQADAQVFRCVGATRCNFHGPLASSSL